MKVLLKYGADVHWPLGPSKDKKTRIILAAAHGNMEMVKLLFKQGAFIEQEGVGNDYFEKSTYPEFTREMSGQRE